MPIANPTVVTGDRSTTVALQQERRVVDMRDRIYDYDPDASPFLTVLSRRLPAVRAINPVYKHLEDQPLPWWDAIGTTFANATATQVTMTNGLFFRIGDVLLIKTTSLGQGYELLKVNGGTAGANTPITNNVLNVVRNYDGDQVNGGSAAGSPAGTLVAIIGNLNEEMADKRTIKSTTEQVQTNFTQILRDPFGSSRSSPRTTTWCRSARCCSAARRRPSAPTATPSG
jgi:hypothetical protein